MMVQKRLFVFLGFLGGAFLFLGLASAIAQSALTDVVKILLLIVAMLFDVLAFSSRYYSYLLIPFMRQRSKDIVLSNENAYHLSPAGDATLRKDGDEFIATVYINIPLYRSATEMTDEEKIDFSRQVSRLVGVSRDPVRFTSELYMMNKDSYIQTLKDTINSIENEVVELTNKKAPARELDRAKGKLAMWHTVLDHVTTAQSLDLATFAAVSARGGKEFEAVSIAQQRARELMSGVGAIFGVTPAVVTGPDLLKLIEPEYLIPFSTVSETINRNVAAVV